MRKLDNEPDFDKLEMRPIAQHSENTIYKDDTIEQQPYHQSWPQLHQ